MKLTKRQLRKIILENLGGLLESSISDSWYKGVPNSEDPEKDTRIADLALAIQKELMHSLKKYKPTLETKVGFIYEPAVPEGVIAINISYGKDKDFNGEPVMGRGRQSVDVWVTSAAGLAKIKKDSSAYLKGTRDLYSSIEKQSYNYVKNTAPKQANMTLEDENWFVEFKGDNNYYSRNASIITKDTETGKRYGVFFALMGPDQSSFKDQQPSDHQRAHRDYIKSKDDSEYKTSHDTWPGQVDPYEEE